MRTFITNIKEKTVIEIVSLTVTALLAIVSISSVVLAYGPDRPTFTITNPANYVTFDSITNDPTYGDERNFFRVRDMSTNESYGDTANLVAGKTYEAQIFYHNNASSDLNASGVGIAHGAYARAEMPAVVKAGTSSTEAEAFVGASNASPTSVYDYINFNNPSNGDIALHYVAGTAKIYNNGATNGQSLGDTSLFSSSGMPLGFDSLNGDLPACNNYSGYITFDFTAVQPNFNFTKSVSLDGNNWQGNVTANHGATVQYKLAYDNTGNAEQDEVTLRDTLPTGVTFIPGSVKLYNALYPNGETENDAISSNGLDIGNYAANSNAYLIFAARIDGAPCAVLTNTARVETDNGAQQGTATVTVAGNCTSVLPHTGPAQVIAGLIGIGAITFGVVYYLKSRRELDYALMHTQAHPKFSKTHPISAPDATSVEDVEADQTQTYSEHKK